MIPANEIAKAIVKDVVEKALIWLVVALVALNLIQLVANTYGYTAASLTIWGLAALAMIVSDAYTSSELAEEAKTRADKTIRELNN